MTANGHAMFEHADSVNESGREGSLLVTVIITTCNRADRLRDTLSRLASQRMPARRWQLLVVDNNSTDTTQQVLADAPPELPLETIFYAKPGKCGAQNRALSAACGDLLVFTDDDVGCDDDWLAALVAAAQRWPDAALFGGRIVPIRVGERPAWLCQEQLEQIIDRQYAAYAPRLDEGPTDVAPIGPNMAIRRLAIGDYRFDEQVGPDGSSDYIKGGDTDINRAMMDAGHRCVYVPSAVVQHRVYPDQLTAEALFAGVYRRGRKNGYLMPRRGKVQVLGVPLRLWLALLRQWCRFSLTSSRSPRFYAMGEKYHFRRGLIAQMRRQTR